MTIESIKIFFSNRTIETSTCAATYDDVMKAFQIVHNNI